MRHGGITGSWAKGWDGGNGEGEDARAEVARDTGAEDCADAQSGAAAVVIKLSWVLPGLSPVVGDGCWAFLLCAGVVGRQIKGIGGIKALREWHLRIAVAVSGLAVWQIKAVGRIAGRSGWHIRISVAVNRSGWDGKVGLARGIGGVGMTIWHEP